MNIIDTMELSVEANRTPMATIFYHRYSDTEYEEYDPKKKNAGARKKYLKCEMISLNSIKRVSLSMSSFTLVYDVGYIKFNVPIDWELQPLIDLCENKWGKGLNVIQHFAKFRTSNIETNK